MFTSKMFHTPTSVGSKGVGAFFASCFGGGPTSSGIVVTESKALAIPTYHACVTTLASNIAQLPCHLYQREPDEKSGRTKAVDHPAYRLVHDQPNERQTPYEYFEQQVLSTASRGNGYAFIEWNDKSQPTAILPLDASRTTVLVSADGMPFYDTGSPNGPIPMRLINHVRWFSMDGYVGMSPIKCHAETLGLAIATREHASAVFASGTNLAGVLERPAMIGQNPIDPLSKERVREIQASWEERYSGSGNAKRVAVLQDGITFRPLSMTNEDAQLIDSRKMSSYEIAQIYNMPPHKVGLLDNATFSNIEHQGIEFVVNTLMPWLKRFEQAMNRDLLLPSERGKFYFEFNVSGLLRGDTKSRYDSYALGRQWGWLSINDIRRMENLPPIPNGDDYLTPMNMQPAGSQQAKADVNRALRN